MELQSMALSSQITLPNPKLQTRSQVPSSLIPCPEPFLSKTHLKPLTKASIGIQEKNLKNIKDKAIAVPTMEEILASSKSQNLDLQLKKLGPFFRITARNVETQQEVGRAEGVIRVWLRGKILHLDSIRLKRESLGMEKSIFGIGLLIGAVAVRLGYECGCNTAELLAINDSDLYHSKLVRFYTRIGFKVVHEVSGSSIGDIAHMLVWGGVGTRMDADVEQLLLKWCTRFKT